MSIGTLAFCETAAQVDRLAGDGAGFDVTYLAVTPEAAWRLGQRGMAYRKPEDFYDEAELCRLSQPIADLEERWVNWLDDRLQLALPELKPFDFRPARCHFYYLKVLADEVFMRAFILDRVLSACRPAEAVYFTPSQPPALEWDLLFRESVYSLLLPLFAREREIKATGHEDGQVWAGASRRAEALTAYGKTLRGILPPGLRARARLLATYGWKDLLRSLKPGDRTAPKVILHPSYDVEPLWLLASSKGFRCRLWLDVRERLTDGQEESGDIQGRASRLWTELGTEPEIKRLFEYAGLDLSAAAEPRLRYWLERVVPETWQVFLSARRVLRDETPAAIVLPHTGSHVEVAALHAARSLAIPTALYQHGGFVASCEYVTWDYTDLRDADYLLSYGPDTTAYFDARAGRYKEPRAALVSVGSARLDAVRQLADVRKTDVVKQRLLGGQAGPLVLYVPALFFGYTRYLDGTYPEVSYFEMQREVGRIFRDFPGIRFVYKTFKEFAECFGNPVPDMLRKTCPNCTVVQDVPLTELIWAADAIIVDFPSTGLLEALLTDSRILCYADNRSLLMTRTAKELLGRRATLTETPEAFLQELRRFLAAGNFAKESPANRDFLKAYGTHLDDGRSAERALERLAEIIRFHPSRKPGIQG